MLDYREFYSSEEYIDDDDSDAVFLSKLGEYEIDGEQEEEEREYIPSYPVDERSSSNYKTRNEICPPHGSEFRSDD